ncbi:hypothetical protein EST38_g1387 [Candolleomyces aberdarensis]|uniref:Uncharacterized protein n=1 Tax=Candolleomyces aberdarensis TaxID=2316362 RepID=A0A4V1Q563_9AGAR|nr:hypothetical protein EST38_g1387 [Candolleomyces aberdarensis]
MKPRIPLTPTPALPKVKCPELRQLPKSPRPHGMTYRHQNPGTPTKLIAPHVNEPFLDPNHPAVRASKRKEPWMVSWNNSRSEAFRVVAAPKAMLFRPDVVHDPLFGLMFEKWEDKVTRLADSSSGSVATGPPTHPPPTSRKGKEKETLAPDAQTNTEAFLDEGLTATDRYVARRKNVLSKAVPMSVMFATNKAKMGGKPSYMSKVKKRVKGAIALVVNQGAKVVEEQTQMEDGTLQVQKKVVCDLQEVDMMKGKSWVVPGALCLLVFPFIAF